MNIEGKEHQQEKKRKRPRKGLERSSWYGGEGMKEGMNHQCHMAQRSDLARMDTVQVDSESMPGRWPLHSVALNATTTTDFPAR